MSTEFYLVWGESPHIWYLVFKLPPVSEALGWMPSTWHSHSLSMNPKAQCSRQSDFLHKWHIPCFCFVLWSYSCLAINSRLKCCCFSFTCTLLFPARQCQVPHTCSLLLYFLLSLSRVTVSVGSSVVPPCKRISSDLVLIIYTPPPGVRRVPWVPSPFYHLWHNCLHCMWPLGEARVHRISLTSSILIPQWKKSCTLNYTQTHKLIQWQPEFYSRTCPWNKKIDICQSPPHVCHGISTHATQ